MKFNININQLLVEEIDKITESELDFVNIAILHWFIDFDNTCKTKTIANYNGKEFFLVTRSKIINDLPAIRIKDEKSIGRRIDKLITAGLLEKKKSKDSKGRKNYYRQTDKLKKAIYIKNKKDTN